MVYSSITDHTIECDGIVHCPLAEDEDFEKCKKTFPETATIECEYKYYKGQGNLLKDIDFKTVRE
jgi:hypothetical protein